MMKNIRMKAVLRRLLAASAAAVILTGAAGSVLPAYALTTAPKKAEKEETDSAEGFESAMLNVHSFRGEWSRSQKLYLVYAVLGQLSENEEKKLRLFLGLERNKRI